MGWVWAQSGQCKAASTISSPSDDAQVDSSEQRLTIGARQETARPPAPEGSRIEPDRREEPREVPYGTRIHGRGRLSTR
jgi:hypothetical protein